jgi:hypothetical protein
MRREEALTITLTTIDVETAAISNYAPWRKPRSPYGVMSVPKRNKPAESPSRASAGSPVHATAPHQSQGIEVLFSSA